MARRTYTVKISVDPGNISIYPQVYATLKYRDITDVNGAFVTEDVLINGSETFEREIPTNTLFRLDPKSPILDHEYYKTVVNGVETSPYFWEIDHITNDWTFVLMYRPETDVSAEFSPAVVNIRDNEVPPTIPKLLINYKNVNRLLISGEGFNGGVPVEKTVAFSRDTNQLQTYLSFDLWEKSLGTKIVEIIGINDRDDDRRAVTTATVQFNEVTNASDPDGGTEFISAFRTNKDFVIPGDNITVFYTLVNLENWGTDSTGAVHPIRFFAESETDSSLIRELGEGRINESQKELEVPNYPVGTYKIFALAPNNEKLYSNVLLTVSDIYDNSETYIPLSAQDIEDNIMSAICSKFNLAQEYSDFLNETQVLQNLLVDKDSRHEELIISHIRDNDDSVIFKLYDPLNGIFKDKDEFYLVREVIDPYVVSIDLSDYDDDGGGEYEGPDVGIVIGPPNWEIYDDFDLGLPVFDPNIIDVTYGDGTGYKTTEEFGTEYVSGSTITDIFNTLISGSSKIDDTGLGIEFNSFNQFIFYSSAKERLTNFKNKLELIEIHQVATNNINEGGAVTGSLPVTTELNRHSSEINRIKNGFDGYEQFLYYSSADAAWPKTNNVVQPSTSSLATTYFTSQSAVAVEFDDDNQYSLIKDLPEHIRRDPDNVSFLTFVSMIGHHFDLIKTHVDSLQKIFIRSHSSGSGTPEKLVEQVLDSVGWQIRPSQAQNELSEYLLGKHKTGTQTHETSGKSRRDLLLRRFLNNFPYLYKSKGTRKAIRGLFALYGIPESILTIREFGGPALMSSKKTYFQFEDPTAVLNLSSSQNIQIDVEESDLTRKPDTFEVTFKCSSMPTSSSISGSYNLLNTGTPLRVFLDSEPSSSYNGRVRVSTNGVSGIEQISSSVLPIFDDQWFTMMVRRTKNGDNHTIDLFVKKALYANITHAGSASMVVSASTWDTMTSMTIGNTFSGSIDEFRMWKVPITEDSFNHHVYWKESIRGNHYTSSMTDLLVRLPFEQPQNLNSNTTLTNFAYTGSNAYTVVSASANNFPNVATSPYQYSWLEHPSVYESPSVGFKQDTDKIRFEDIHLIDGQDLNPFTRVTKKSFDYAPVDTNKVGVFFSPTNEVNRDIIRAFTGYDFMNEIGDPASRYSSSYDDLKDINTHYWSRHNVGMNIYDYITLVRQMDKSVFEYLRDIVPVRAQVIKGLLIEPHLLERNRIQHNRPTKEDLYWDTTYDVFESQSIEASYPVYNAEEEISSSFWLNATYPTYDGTEDTSEYQLLTGSYPTYTSEIPSTYTTSSMSADWLVYETSSWSPSSTPTVQTEMDKLILEEVPRIDRWKVPNFLGYAQSPFGIFGWEGESELIFMKDGKEFRKKYKIEVVTKSETRTTRQLIDGNTDGQNGEYQDVTVSDSVRYLNVFDMSGSFTAGSERLHGYLPQHRTRVTDLTRGMMNSFYNGSKLTEANTVDGAPVEWFFSKSRTIKVVGDSTDGSEPILEVE